MLPPRVRALLDVQDGVVARRQLLARGATPNDIQRWRRRRELVLVHPGVYVDHTAALTWRQRAWTAVRVCQPAALWGASAIRVEEGAGGATDEVVIVAVAPGRKIVAPAGVRVVRRTGLRERALWERRPPRQRYDDAIVDAALTAFARSAASAVAIVTGAVQQRRTTAARLRANLTARPRAGSVRHELAAVLLDVEHGTTSVLEHAYLTQVERAHGLPRSRLQQPFSTSSRNGYRDVLYDDLVVELDSRGFHDSTERREADFDRDLDAAVSGLRTVRLTYRQVVDRPCSTAGKVGRLLARHGWPGRVLPCGAACAAPALFSGVAV